MPTQTRQPQQERAIATVGRIRAAAAHLFDAHDYDQVGIRDIAERADVSVGVVYRYFPDKSAIVVDLLEHWLAGDVDLITDVTAPHAASPHALLERVVAAFADRFRQLPGFRRLRFHGPFAGTETAAGTQSNQRIADRLYKVLTEQYSLPRTVESRRRLLVAVEVGSAMLDLAFRQDPHGDDAILSDTAEIMFSYLYAISEGAPHRRRLVRRGAGPGPQPAS